MDFSGTQQSIGDFVSWRKLKIYKILLMSAFGVIMVGVVAATWTFFGANRVKSESWQAVFLRNDQVYFGRLTISDDFYILTNVYYLQTEEEQEEDKLAPVSTTSVNLDRAKKKTKTTLVKLGNELHGPENEMFIERGNVLFWENLKDNSGIVNSIKASEKSL